MEKAIIMGNIGKDAEVVTIAQKTYLKFSVGCNRGKDANKKTTWYDALYYSTALQPYLTKGKKVLVMGNLQCGAYLNRNNEAVASPTIYADTVEFADSPATQQQQSPGAPQPTYAGLSPQAQPVQQQQQPAVADDDLPF